MDSGSKILRYAHMLEHSLRKLEGFIFTNIQVDHGRLRDLFPTLMTGLSEFMAACGTSEICAQRTFWRNCSSSYPITSVPCRYTRPP